MSEFPENDYRNYLAHHGILGMKWGVRRSDTYPLKPSEHSASEKKAGWQKSLDGGSSSGKKAKKAKADSAKDKKPKKEKDLLYNIYNMNASAYEKLGNKKFAGIQRAAANARLKDIESKRKAKETKENNAEKPSAKENKPKKEKDLLYNIYNMNANYYEKRGKKKYAGIQREAANARLRELEKKRM